jgi:hypothetical protein
MRRTYFIFIMTAGLLALAAGAIGPALADDAPSINQFTIPTPTSPSGGGGGGGGEEPPPPQPTATGESGATSTPTTVPAGTIAPTPEGGYLPTAEPCDPRPLVQAVNPINVRSGPGSDYEVIDQLLFLETRYIVGRYGFGEWWLIELAGGDTGWVADFVVRVSGYTGLVPLVDAPPLDGATPTPGAVWAPTPWPSCTVTPTPTPPPTATGTLTVTPTATATPVPTDTAEPEEPAGEEVAAATEPPPAPPATATPAPENTAVPTTAPTATPAPDDGGSGSSSTWLLLGGLGLVLAGAIGFFVMGRRGG